MKIKFAFYLQIRLYKIKVSIKFGNSDDKLNFVNRLSSSNGLFNDVLSLIRMGRSFCFLVDPIQRNWAQTRVHGQNN